MERAQDLVEITAELLRRNGDTRDQYIRPLLYKGAPAIRLQLSDLDDRICIFTLADGRLRRHRRPARGHVRLAASQRQRRAGARQDHRLVRQRGLAVEDAHAAGYGEAVLLTSEGHVAEASSANLFVVFEGRIETPPLSDDVLAGVTRSAVMQLGA